MSKETVLGRVEADVARGDLGKARDRLHGLVHDYPGDLTLRARLAAIYHRLQFPVMAGRYWYLEEHRAPEMEHAVRAFERSYGGDPLLILAALKVQGDLSQLPEHAKGRVTALREAVAAKYPSPPADWPRSRIARRVKGVPYVEISDADARKQMRRAMRMPGFVRIGNDYVAYRFVAAGAVIAGLAVIGFFTVLSWIAKAWR